MSFLRVFLIFIATFAIVKYVAFYLQSPNSSSHITTFSQITLSTEYQSDGSKEDNRDDPHSYPSNHVVKPGSPNYTHWCLDVSHNNIYNLGSKLNCKDNSEAFSMSFLLAILFTILIEYSTHTLEKRVGGHKVYLTILNKIYKELMMMGLIGFIINVGESLNIFDGLFRISDSIAAAFGFPSQESSETSHQRIARRVLIFDFVHISLFFLSIFYVLIVILIYYLVKITWKRWKTYEKGTYEQAVRRYNVLRQRIDDKNKFLFLFDWILLYKYYSNSRRLSYFSIKQRFLKQNKLEPKFRFHTYLRNSLLHIFIKLIEIDWKLLMVVWCAFLVNYIRNKVVNLDTGMGGVPMFSGFFGGASLFLSVIMFLGCRVGVQFYRKQHCCWLNNQLPVNLQQEEPSSNYEQQTKGEVTGLLLEEPVVHEKTHDEQTEDSTIEIPGTKPVQMRKYIPFFSPGMSFLCIQICMLFQSFYLAMMVIHFAFVIVVEDGISDNVPFRWVILLCCLLPSFLVCLILFPLTIPDFTILYSVENRVNKTLLKAEVKHEEKKKENIYEEEFHHTHGTNMHDDQ